ETLAGKSQPGLGLGLAIVRHIIELHGGQVDVESDGLGKGACFVVRIPRGDDVTAADLDAEPASRSSIELDNPLSLR
ncbi:MAG TPA: ATP-binding protein, partial [Polyangiaceae bacterium]|nr:ATP-binding protein [Polyangiaceae bacterium]